MMKDKPGLLAKQRMILEYSLTYTQHRQWIFDFCHTEEENHQSRIMRSNQHQMVVNVQRGDILSSLSTDILKCLTSLS